MRKFRLLVSSLAVATAAFGAMAQTIDCTSQVQTSKEAWHGSDVYGAVTVTVNGNNVNPAEHYYNNGCEAGTLPLYQNVAGLEAGTYNVKLLATAFNAWKGDAALTSDSYTVAELYATAGETTKTVAMLAQQKSNYSNADVDTYTYTISGVEVAEGQTLDLGIKVLEGQKCEWYTIQILSLERMVGDLLSALRQQAEQLLASEDYKNVVGEERTNLQAELAKTDATAESLQECITAFTQARVSYDAFFTAKENARNAISENGQAAAASINDLETVCGTDPTTAAEAQSSAELLNQAIPALVISNSLLEGVENSQDLTDKIVNPMGDDNDCLQGWTDELSSDCNAMRINGGEGPSLYGQQVEHYFDSDNWGKNNWSQKFYQSVDLEAGKYRVSVLARASEGFDAFYFFAGDKQVNIPMMGSSNGTFGRGWNNVSVDVEHAGGPLEIGIYAEATSGQKWLSFDYFRLAAFPKGSSGIENVEAAPVAKDEAIYDLMGRRVVNPASGIYIVNGKKVVIRK